MISKRLRNLNRLLSAENIILFLILLLAAILRFYRLPEMVNFDFDQEYASTFVWNVVNEYPFRFIGQGLSVEGLFMGPWYFYYLVPFYMLTGLHPLGGYVGSVLLGLLIIFVYYSVGRSLFGNTAGLAAAFLRAVNFPSIDADWTMVPSYSSDLLVLITWYLLYRLWIGEKKWLPVLALVFGMFTSFHPIQIPFYLVFILLWLLKRWRFDIKTILFSVAAFLIPNIPLLLFEYFRKGAMIKRILEIISSDKGGESLLLERSTKFITLIGDFYQSIFQFQFNYEWLIFLPTFVGVAFLFFELKKDKNRNFFFHLIALPLTFLVFILYYLVFPTHVPEYYMGALRALMILYLGGVFWRLGLSKFGKIIAVFILLVVLFNNLQMLSVNKWKHENLVTLYHKDQIVKKIVESQKGQGDFFVSYISTPGWNFGFDYLFKQYHVEPQKEIKEPIYTIVIPRFLVIDDIDYYSGNIGLILPD